MTEADSLVLDFDALDGVAFAAERGRLHEHKTPLLKTRDIGPVLEFFQLAKSGLLPSLRAASWLCLGRLNRLVRWLEDDRMEWICPQTHRMGFLRTMPTLPQDETVWVRFGLNVQRAAKWANFPKQVAAQLTAALGELYSNIYEHSRATETGVVAFQAHKGIFEFVVADSGIGILNSLRTYTDYSEFNDHGKALQQALTEGISRYGPHSSRGYGFRPLFVGLANLHSALRFRSGDHALLIDGRKPSLISARLAQKPLIQGFLVSVTCIA